MEILHWKEIQTPEGLRPALFFHPSLAFLTYLNNYGHRNIPVTILNSMFYDGMYMTDVEVTTQIPGQQQFYSIVLDRDFTLIPVQKGTIQLSKSSPQQSQVPSPEHHEVNNDVIPSCPSSPHPQDVPERYDDLLSQHDDRTTYISPPTPTPTPTPTTFPPPIPPATTSSPCPPSSLRLWQIFLIILALVIILISCFYPFLR